MKLLQLIQNPKSLNIMRGMMGISMGGYVIKIQKNTEHYGGHSNSGASCNQLRKKHVLCSGIEIFEWGDKASDFQFSYDAGLSHLVLHGYITEISGFRSFISQQEACNLLKEYMDKCHSSVALRDLADKINGSFALSYINEKEMKIYTITDRVLSRPIFYMDKDGQGYIASQALPIAQFSGDHTLRPECIASVILYGAVVDPRKTSFKNIYCQSAGSIYEHEVGKIIETKKTLWYQYSHMPDTSRPLYSWVKLVSERLVVAARRILSTTANPLLFLSGGVDSRIAGAALVAAGGKPLFCTLGDANNMEMKIAKQVAHSLKGTHKTIIRDEEWYLRNIKKAMFSTNGSFSWAHSHFSQAYSLLRKSHGVDAALLGDFCEVFSKMCCTLPKGRTVVWSENEFVNEFDHLPLPNYRAIDGQRTLRLLNEDVRKTAEEMIENDIRERYANLRYASKDPMIVGDLFFRWHMAPSIATFQMFNDVRSAGPERNIMFDKDVHQLLEIMPSTLRTQCNLGARLVHHLNAKAALIPNSNTLLPLMMPLAAHEFAKRAKPVLGKLRRRLLSNTYKTTASWQHLPLLYHANPKWHDNITHMLIESESLPSEIFDLKEVRGCWERFCDGDLSRHADVERLFGLAHFFEILKSPSTAELE